MTPMTRALTAGVLGGVVLPAMASWSFAAETLKGNALDMVIRQAQHDIVLIDTKLKIVADTMENNVGKVFSEDPGKEVSQTLKDGKARTFTERGKDYPNGIKQQVVAVKDARGKIIGAVIVSSDIIKR